MCVLFFSPFVYLNQKNLSTFQEYFTKNTSESFWLHLAWWMRRTRVDDTLQCQQRRLTLLYSFTLYLNFSQASQWRGQTCTLIFSDESHILTTLKVIYVKHFWNSDNTISKWHLLRKVCSIINQNHHFKMVPKKIPNAR